jgi:hypothetical protein
MTEAEWDAVYSTHLKGTYAVAKAAWPVLQKGKYGRIITTASSVGVHGNFGQVRRDISSFERVGAFVDEADEHDASHMAERMQANYSTAKSAIIGLTRTLAIEGKKVSSHFLLSSTYPPSTLPRRLPLFKLHNIDYYHPSDSMASSRTRASFFPPLRGAFSPLRPVLTISLLVHLFPLLPLLRSSCTPCASFNLQSRPERRYQHECVFFLVFSLFFPSARSASPEPSDSHAVLMPSAPPTTFSAASTVWPEEMVRAFSPDFVSPVVGYLGSEDCETTQSTYEVSGGWGSALRWQRTKGYAVCLLSRSSLPSSPH